MAQVDCTVIAVQIHTNMKKSVSFQLCNYIVKLTLTQLSVKKCYLRDLFNFQGNKLPDQFYLILCFS